MDFHVIGPSIWQVGTACRMKTDQPRVVSIPEPPVVIDALIAASANLPVQAAETVPSGRIIMGMGT